MSDEYEIVGVDKPDWATIGQAIGDYNQQQAGDDKSEYLCFVLHSPDQVVVGGVIGEVHYGWLHVVLLWVKEDLRGRGYGHRLLVQAEDEGRRRGATDAYLDTFSFQAPEFYRRQGYEIFGELLDFPPGHQHYFLTKPLEPVGSPQVL